MKRGPGAQQGSQGPLSLESSLTRPVPPPVQPGHRRVHREGVEGPNPPLTAPPLFQAALAVRRLSRALLVAEGLRRLPEEVPCLPHRM